MLFDQLAGRLKVLFASGEEDSAKVPAGETRDVLDLRAEEAVRLHALGPGHRLGVHTHRRRVVASHA